MMEKTYARIDDGIVAEIYTLPGDVKITDAVHPDLVKEWVSCPEKVEQGWIYDGKTFTAPEPFKPAPVDLGDCAANKRWQIETGGITFNGMQVATDRESQSMIGNAVQMVKLTGKPVQFKTANGFVELSSEQMQNIAVAVATHVQACFAAEADVQAKIKSGEIDSVDKIDAYPWPGSPA